MLSTGRRLSRCSKTRFCATQCMPSKNPAQRLKDIIDNIDAIRMFTSGMSLDKFSDDLKTIYAVTRAREIISEASRRLPEDFKGRYGDIDWTAVAAAGNVYRHEYEVVDDALFGTLSSTAWRTCEPWLWPN